MGYVPKTHPLCKMRLSLLYCFSEPGGRKELAENPSACAEQALCCVSHCHHIVTTDHFTHWTVIWEAHMP
jgi:hypothetical protein